MIWRSVSHAESDTPANTKRARLNYHEAGTLWVGPNSATFVTDPNGRFHNVANDFGAASRYSLKSAR
jgi:hypothetical protein